MLGCVHQQAKLNDAFTQDLGDRQKEIVKRHGPTTEAEMDAAMETALEEGNVVGDLPRGGTVEGVVLNGQRESNKDWGVKAEQYRLPSAVPGSKSMEPDTKGVSPVPQMLCLAIGACVPQQQSAPSFASAAAGVPLL